MQRYVESRLALKYSPEQIVDEAKKEGLPCVSYETIYQKIWADKKQGGKLCEHLHCQKRGNHKDKRGQIPNRRPITERPAEVEKRQRLGDLEIDLIIGSGQKEAILTITTLPLETITHTENALNSRPRKRHNFLSLQTIHQQRTQNQAPNQNQKVASAY